MDSSKNDTLREMIYTHFAGKTFSPSDVSEATGRDLRSVRTSLQRFTRANFVIRNRRGEYVLNEAHPQVIKLSGVASASVSDESQTSETVSVESSTTA